MPCVFHVLRSTHDTRNGSVRANTRTLARFVPSERVQQRKRNDTPNTQRKSHRRRVSHLQRHAVRFRFLRLQYIRATVHMLSVCPSMTTAHPKADTLARHDPNSVRVPMTGTAHMLRAVRWSVYP